jgi:hypothetical protein
LLKDRVADLTQFPDALNRVASKGSALDPEVVAQLLARSRHPLAALTPRERVTVVSRCRFVSLECSFDYQVGVPAGTAETFSNGKGDITVTWIKTQS